jgi:rare lipoprotein A
VPSSIGNNRAYIDLHFLADPTLFGMGGAIRLRAARGCQQEGYDAMPMRRTIGISLACLVTSACAVGKTPEESASHYPGEANGVPQGNPEMTTGKSHSITSGAAGECRSADFGSEQVAQRRAKFEPAADGCAGIADRCCGRARTSGIGQFGKAAWYNLVGNQTASGEILDTVTATAAHRTLPLASFAKVTNLGNRRSVIVKINDRGPYTRGRILDLSPRAADALDMKRAGVAAVVLEPLISQPVPTVAVFQTSDTTVAQ